MPTTTSPGRMPWLPLLGLAVVLAAAAAAFWLMRSERRASQWVTHTVAAQFSISRFGGEVIRFESSYRGYVTLPQPELLEDMTESRQAAYAALAGLNAELRDNPAQIRRLARLRALLDQKVAIGAVLMQAAREGRLMAALRTVPGDRGRLITGEMRDVMAAMLAEEDRLLRLRQAEAQRLSAMISAGLVGAVLLVMIVAGLMVQDANNRSRLMERSRDEALTAERMAREANLAQAEAEAKLRQMQKMEAVGQLTGGVAHDFNNMLAIIIGSLDLAERRINNQDKLRRAIANAREGAERAAGLTNRLLAFSRQSPLAPVPLDVNQLVSDMLEMLRRTLGEQIEIETMLAGDLWRTYADSQEVENALLNLAVNARDAMAGMENGRLIIETENTYFDDSAAGGRIEVMPGSYVMIGVTDTGCGMSAEVLRRAFDPFFTTKEVGKGTGLGLSQVFGFAKQSRGHASIYSEPGRGTTVKLYLPRYQGPEIEAENKESKEPPAVADEAIPLGRRDEVILVCEDEESVRLFSIDALRELGYTAISAAEGGEALRILRERPGIAMLFTDIVMPGISGRSLADRAQEVRPAVKILYTTGYTRNAVVHNGVLEPGVAFLPKPFTVAQLARKVRDVLDGRGANRPPA